MEHKVASLLEADKSDTVDLHTLLLLIRDSITFYCGNGDKAMLTSKVWSRQDLPSDSDEHKRTVVTEQPSLSRRAITDKKAKIFTEISFISSAENILLVENMCHALEKSNKADVES